jgi:hypothetical protein
MLVGVSPAYDQILESTYPLVGEGARRELPSRYLFGIPLAILDFFLSLPWDSWNSPMKNMPL